MESVSLSFLAVQSTTADTIDCRWFVYTGSKGSPIKPTSPSGLQDHLANVVFDPTLPNSALSKSVFGDYRVVLAMADAVTTKEASYKDQAANSVTLKPFYAQGVDPFEIGIAENYLSFKHFQRVAAGHFRFACFLDGYTIKRRISIN